MEKERVSTQAERDEDSRRYAAYRRELNVKSAMTRAEVMRPLILEYQGKVIPENKLGIVNIGLDLVFLADEVKRLTEENKELKERFMK